MQVSASSNNLALVNPGRRRVEKATDYVGPLATTGKDVGIAVIDSGVSRHGDLQDKVAANVSFYDGLDPQVDSWGHGTSTAGVIVGSGSASGGEVVGVAPGAKVLNLQVLTKQAGPDPYAGIEAMKAALDWSVAHKEEFNIKVINISGALAPIRDDQADVAAANAAGIGVLEARDEKGALLAIFLDPLDAAVKRAVAAGIVIVAAAGNDGPTNGTVYGTPNHHPDVITVGSLDTNGTPGNLTDDFVAKHSSRGPTITGQLKPDLVAPGVGIVMPFAAGSDIARENEAMATRYQAIASVPDKELLVFLDQATSARKIAARPFEEALPQLYRLLPEQFRGVVDKAEPDRQAAMALKLAGALAAKGVLDTEGVLFQSAVSALREASQALAPAPTLGSALVGGQPIYMADDGTSVAAPIVTSVIAHMFEANPNLTPAQVKEILTSTARPIAGADAYSAGAGALNAQAAIERARELAR